MKKLICIFCGIILIGTLSGCGKSNDAYLTDTLSKTNGNCTPSECMEQITIDDDLAAVNQIIGFDGVLTNASANQYTWSLSDKASIVVSFYSGSYVTIKLDVSKDEMKNKKVDLSNLEELEKRVDSGEKLTYDDVVKNVGGVDGVLIDKNSSTNKYRWVNEDGGYVEVYFRASTGELTSFYGWA